MRNRLVVHVSVSTIITAIVVGTTLHFRWKQLSHFVNAHTLDPDFAGSSHGRVEQLYVRGGRSELENIKIQLCSSRIW